jgi:hypothetical protein
MNAGSAATSSTPDMIRKMIEHEVRAAEICRREAAQTIEPRLRETLMKLSRRHLDHVRELQTFMGEDDARAAITRQINDMFL